MKHAVGQMQQGVTLSDARDTCPNRSLRGHDMMSQMLSAFFGGSVVVIQRSGGRNEDQRARE
jgi:hypothetical protein